MSNYNISLPSTSSTIGGTLQVTDGVGVSYTYNGLIMGGGASGAIYVSNATNTKKGRIGPKLYFNYVKSKLTKTQTKKLKSRLQKLQALVKKADEVGQKALYEEFSEMLIVAVRESEAAACGYDVYVNRADVDKFRHQVTESDSDSQNPVYFKKLEEFPRALPAKIQRVVKSVQSKGIFDELYVLYLDYTKEVVKSTKEKIREKDPILFGKFSYDEKRLYFIADWIDKHCDLTLSKFVDQLKKDDEEYQVSTLEELTPEYLERIKQEMKDREDRLKGVNPSNFRDRMAEEDKAELARLREENVKLRDAKRFLDEDKEIAVEKALAKWGHTSEEDKAIARAQWREEARKELLEIAEEKDKELSARKKPWYRRFF